MRLLQENPKLKEELGSQFICTAARYCIPPILKLLSTYGWDVNFLDVNATSPLEHSIANNNFANTEKLLELGADPNLGCPLFQVAMFVENDSVSYAKLLLGHGADINQPFIVEGMPSRNGLSEAVESGDDELAEFLRANGARMPNPQIDGVPKPRSAQKEVDDYSDAIIAHVEKRFGQVADGALIEIVPTTDHPIAINYVSKSKSIDGASIYFTTGLSRYEKNVPKGQRKFRFAELLFAVPADWPAPEAALDDPERAWAVQWLRRIVAHPIDNDTWLGGEVTTIANDAPAQPLSKGTKFTAWLLASPDDKDNRIKVKRDITINLYQMFPLYNEEYKLERSHGVAALMELVHKIGMPEFIDNNRPNVAI